MSSTRPDRSTFLHIRWNVSRAASIDKVGTLRVSQSGGTAEIRGVMHRQMLSNWLSSSTTAHILSASVPLGSRIDSALSRTMRNSLEDRNERREARSSGFSIPAPMTLDNRLSTE